MEERNHPENIQNDFFKLARKDRSRLTVFLNSGKKLTGKITGFDRFTILLDGPGGEQMVFKHAISTISTAKTFGNYMNLEGRQSDRDRRISDTAAEGSGTGPETRPVPVKKSDPVA